MKRIGILGGTFDPIHGGHLALARAAIRRLKLDRVLFVPARLSPLKDSRPTPAKHRLAMLRLALKGMRKAKIETLELKRPGRSYKVDTLKALKRKYPHAELFLILGRDAARDLPRWKRPAEICRLATVAIFPRPGLHPAAATRIRSDFSGGRRPSGCPKAVVAYALRHRLYRASN